jgi:uroporphyrin-III C-methyltransferase
MSEQEKPETEAQPVRRDPTTTIVAWVATVIASIALAGGLYLEKEREKLKDRINDVRLELRDTTQALASRDSEFASRDALARIEADANRRMLEIERRYDQLANGFERLRSQTDGARDAWIRSEIEHVLRSAVRAVEVERDPVSAAAALRAVRATLADYGNPVYAQVSDRIDTDIAALERVPVPDIEGIVLTLIGVGNRIDSLPLEQIDGVPQRDSRVRDPGFAGVDWSGIWRSIKSNFRSMITIRREGRPARVLLAPEEEALIHMSSRLKLEGARIASLRGDNTAYRSGLRDARAWIDAWYDTNDGTVQAVLDELQALEGQDLEPELPDISGALRMARTINERLGTR